MNGVGRGRHPFESSLEVVVIMKVSPPSRLPGPTYVAFRLRNIQLECERLSRKIVVSAAWNRCLERLSGHLHF
jgi:hypothetical protein